MNSPWNKFARKHERTFTCPDEGGRNTLELSDSTDPKWMASDTASLEDHTTAFFGRNKPNPNLNKPNPNLSVEDNRTLNISRSALRNAHQSSKTDKSQRTARDLSRELEKAQRILEIDNDILKSQIKNISSDYKARKEDMEVESHVLTQKTRKLESVVMEDKREIHQLGRNFDKMLTFVEGRFTQQEEYNRIQHKEIQSLKGTIKVLEMNSKASSLLDNSNSRRGYSPTPSSHDEEKEKLKEKVKLITFELASKNKEIQEYRRKISSNTSHIQGSKEEIQLGDMFWNPRNSRECHEGLCKQLLSLTRSLVSRYKGDSSELEVVQKYLKEAISIFKSLESEGEQPQCTGEESSWHKDQREREAK